MPKIYTKRGDTGLTDLLAGVRVSKADPRIEAYGTVDELNAILGAACADNGVPPEARTRVTRIQSELFQLGTELATPAGKPLLVEPVDDGAIHRLEAEIDAMEADLEPLKSFILPGGSTGAALFHVARTVCRRAERSIVSLEAGLEGKERLRPDIVRYVNRLSDYLFVCARWVNRRQGREDVPWVAPRKNARP